MRNQPQKESPVPKLNSRPSASNFKSFLYPWNNFFLTAGQNHFGNKIPLFTICYLTIIALFLIWKGGICRNITYLITQPLFSWLLKWIRKNYMQVKTDSLKNVLNTPFSSALLCLVQFFNGSVFIEKLMFLLTFNILSDCHYPDEINYLLKAFRRKKRDS